MDNDDQLDDDEVLDNVGDEQEPLNEPNHESSPAMVFHQPSSLSFSQNTLDNMIDPTPPFEKPTQSIWDPTQKFYVGLLFANKDELQATIKHYHIKRNQHILCKRVRSSMLVCKVQTLFLASSSMLPGYTWVV